VLDLGHAIYTSVQIQETRSDVESWFRVCHLGWEQASHPMNQYMGTSSTATMICMK
jgi:hypothetical protein